MDDQERQRAADWFDDKWHYGACPVCHVEQWGLYPMLGQIANHSGDNTVPVLLVACENCGHTVPVNALIAGIIQRPEPSGDAP